jgi:hypothetical protein
VWDCLLLRSDFERSRQEIVVLITNGVMNVGRDIIPLFFVKNFLV